MFLMCGKSIDDVRKSLNQKKEEPVLYPGVDEELITDPKKVGTTKKEVKGHGKTLEEIHAFVDELK